MTEIVVILSVLVILLIASGFVYLFRMVRRGWCRLSGQDYQPAEEKPLPIVRFAGFVRRVLQWARSRVGSRGAKKGPRAESLETE